MFPPARRSLANGLVTCAALLAYAFVHPLFGWLMDGFDWPGAFMISAFVAAGVASIWFYSAPAAANARQSHEGSMFSFAPSAWLANRNLMLLTFSYAAVGYHEHRRKRHRPPRACLDAGCQRELRLEMGNRARRCRGHGRRALLVLDWVDRALDRRAAAASAANSDRKS